MHHRHLLPNEFDLLLDEPSGFGVRPLREHVEQCDACRARLDEARSVVTALAELPVFAPRIGLADRVMAQVPVFEPWHVAARDLVRRWTPASQTARLLAASLVAVVGSLLTAVTLWVATRGDLLAMVTGLAGESASSAIASAADDLVVAVFGPGLLAAVQQVGPVGLAFAAGGFVVASLGTILGLRRIATSSRARR